MRLDYPQTPDTIAAAKHVQLRERRYAVAAILADFDDVSFASAEPHIQLHYLDAARVGMQAAAKGRSL